MRSYEFLLKVYYQTTMETENYLRNHRHQKRDDLNLQKHQNYSFLSLFRFANRRDWIMMFFGTLGSFAAGAATPLFIYFLVAFSEAYTQLNSSNILEQSLSVFLEIIYLGIGTFLVGWVMLSFWLISGARQISKCRKSYLQSLINQEIGYFDCIDQSQLSVKFSMDMLIFQQALGQKMALVLQIIGCFICTLVISFSHGWLLTLVIAASFLLIIIFAYFNIGALQSKQKKFLSIYMEAGGKAQQVLSSIKTVKQLNGQSHEERSYQYSLKRANLHIIKYCLKIALFYGLMKFSVFFVYYIGLWEGSNCIEGNNHCPLSIIHNTYTIQDVGTIFFTFYGTAFTFSQLVPALKKIGEARVAAQRIFQIIDRVPKVKNPENGLKPEHFKGCFQLINVTFAYPKNKSAIILKNISIKFDILRTALVGDSGCGKSTILQLLMRFYDPDEGVILLDGIDIQDIDLYWLRSKIGYVGQQPVLFSGSIKDNLLMGNSKATPQEMDDALRQAEAYQFVYNQLDHKLETFVGAGGSQISGGQKQRIAIARALLKKPKILLLDEATSALDRRNEKLIQNTFNKISQKLTTITVAHRIRTIINSNLIFVISHGSVQQWGAFAQLKKYKEYEQKRQDNEEMEQEVIIKHPSNNHEKQLKDILDSSHERVDKSQIRIHQQSPPIKFQQVMHGQQQIVDKPWSEIFGRIFKYNQDQMCYFIAAIMVSIAVGVLYPILGIFLSKMLVALKELQSKISSGREEANQSAMAFAILSAVGFVLYSFQSFLGNMIASEITNKLRLQTFHKYLKMPIKWFDRSNNSSTILSIKLSTDCQTINGVASTFIFVLLDSLTSVVAGFITAFIYQWRITLVALGLIPLIALGYVAKNYFIVGLSKQVASAHKGSQQIISQSLINIRTVISLNAQDRLIQKYDQQLQRSQESVVHTAIIAGFMNGLALILRYSIFGILLYIGAIFTVNYNVPLGDLLTGIFQCFFVGFVLGNNMQYLPDMSAAKISAIKIFNILDQEDEEEIQIKENSKMLKEGISGDIKFQNICFQYEGRLTKVFEDLSFEIKNGQKVAFVGPSGCGKSTIIQLLLRFYFPQKGTITIGGTDIKDFDIHALRSKFGVVSQQPALFSRSFGENIRYNTDASEEEIRIAARKSNALSFIEGDQKLEAQNEESPKHNNEGFNRVVGVKGLNISGGQKQRVAIARAILRNPQILLLDEATSALDAQNEQKIQQCLDAIMKNKTTITVAHRFETIKNSDQINVLEAGLIIEQGQYKDLMSKKGHFYNMSIGRSIR